MQARDERALPALCERRRRVPAQNMPEQGASRSIVPPRAELLCRGTPVAFVEGITPTIHTRPTDSSIDDDLSCSAARSRAYLHVDVCKPVFARSRLLSSSIVVHSLVDQQVVDQPGFFLLPLLFCFFDLRCRSVQRYSVVRFVRPATTKRNFRFRNFFYFSRSIVRL